MLPFGHAGAAYLLTEPVKKLSVRELLLILLSSVILDFDLIVSFFTQRSHHDLITHTPLGAIAIGLVLVFIFKKTLSRPAKVLIFLALFSHLLLDETGFWFHQLGWQTITDQPQINWLYPLTPFPVRTETVSFSFFLVEYLTKAKADVLAEVVLFVSALILFLKHYEKRNRPS